MAKRLKHPMSRGLPDHTDEPSIMMGRATGLSGKAIAMMLAVVMMMLMGLS